MNLLQVRKVTSVSMLILWIIISVTGVLLFFTRFSGFFGITVPAAVRNLHTYSSFVVLWSFGDTHLPQLKCNKELPKD